jgi:hypothetical protein
MHTIVPTILWLSSGCLLIYVLFPYRRSYVGKVSTLFCVSLTATRRTGIENATGFFV